MAIYLPSLSRYNDALRTGSFSKSRALLTAIFCGFAALLPIVGVVAPKGTVVLLLLAAALAIPTYWCAERRFPIPDLRVSIALAVLVAWCAIASAWSDDTARSLVLVVRIAVILAAGMVLFPIAASLDDAARRRVGVWLMTGFGLGLVFIAVEAGLDYPLLRAFKTASPGKEAFWLTRSAVVAALIVWPVTACVWERGVGWKALAVPVVLGIGSLFLESAAATLGLAAGFAAVLLAVSHRKAGRMVTLAATVVAFAAMPFAAREMYGHGWYRADWLPLSAQHRVEIWDFYVHRIAEKPVLGWGFDASRHMKALYPDPSITGRELAALHPHNAPLQTMLELGALGAVVALALLWLISMRLDGLSGRTRVFGQGLYIAALAIGSVAFGMWQNWWLAITVSVALLVPLTAPSAAGNPDSRGLVRN